MKTLLEVENSVESITTHKMDQMKDQETESEYSDNKITKNKHKQNMQGMWDIIKRLDL